MQPDTSIVTPPQTSYAEVRSDRPDDFSRPIDKSHFPSDYSHRSSSTSPRFLQREQTPSATEHHKQVSTEPMAPTASTGSYHSRPSSPTKGHSAESRYFPLIRDARLNFSISRPQRDGEEKNDSPVLATQSSPRLPFLTPPIPAIKSHASHPHHGSAPPSVQALAVKVPRSNSHEPTSRPFHLPEKVKASRSPNWNFMEKKTLLEAVLIYMPHMTNRDDHWRVISRTLTETCGRSWETSQVKQQVRDLKKKYVRIMSQSGFLNPDGSDLSPEQAAKIQRPINISQLFEFQEQVEAIIEKEKMYTSPATTPTRTEQSFPTGNAPASAAAADGTNTAGAARSTIATSTTPQPQISEAAVLRMADRLPEVPSSTGSCRTDTGAHRSSNSPLNRYQPYSRAIAPGNPGTGYASTHRRLSITATLQHQQQQQQRSLANQAQPSPHSIVTAGSSSPSVAYLPSWAPYQTDNSPLPNHQPDPRNPIHSRSTGYQPRRFSASHTVIPSGSPRGPAPPAYSVVQSGSSPNAHAASGGNAQPRPRNPPAATLLPTLTAESFNFVRRISDDTLGGNLTIQARAFLREMHDVTNTLLTFQRQNAEWQTEQWHRNEAFRRQVIERLQSIPGQISPREPEPRPSQRPLRY
ncbi:hypothetical protein IWQ60_003025 [Tieghemiomyces parasiticus]|uniref:Uncharacterized protein n=1 Tax=Tieghemiomyces parasiticus TaxID=78921 RepID=A0A9W8E0K4_9FUNG|nr:hypothetical protein IWQ60_003025 [Tieghemiomyces parasiticus]